MTDQQKPVAYGFNQLIHEGKKVVEEDYEPRVEVWEENDQGEIVKITKIEALLKEQKEE